MNKASMEIKVDFLCGTDIKDAVQQSIEMLNILPMLAYVKFDFNGISVAVNQNSVVTEDMTERLLRCYHKEIKHWIVEAE